jgi:hypothetical protein
VLEEEMMSYKIVFSYKPPGTFSELLIVSQEDATGDLVIAVRGPAQTVDNSYFEPGELGRMRLPAGKKSDLVSALRDDLSPQPEIQHIREEWKMRTSVEHVDGRTVRLGHDRTAQLNIKILPALKDRFVAHCRRKGITLADWMEAQIIALGEE